jgi:hypothetical protein
MIYPFIFYTQDNESLPKNLKINPVDSAIFNYN